MSAILVDDLKGHTRRKKGGYNSMSKLKLALASLFVTGRITEEELRRLYKLI